MIREILQRVGPPAIDLMVSGGKELLMAAISRRLMAATVMPSVASETKAADGGCPYCRIADALAVTIAHLERAPQAGSEYGTHVALAKRKLEPALQKVTELPASMDAAQLTLQKQVLELEIALSKPVGPHELPRLVALAHDAQRLAFGLAERDERERNRVEAMAEEMEERISTYDNVVEGQGREL